jgi:hypothetical protein
VVALLTHDPTIFETPGLKFQIPTSNHYIAAALNKSLFKNSFSPGWSKMPRCKAPEILRSEAYFNVRCNDEG